MQLNRSGFCCALKVVHARDSIAFDRCLDEVKMMEALKDSGHVVRVYETEVFFFSSFSLCTLRDQHHGGIGEEQSGSPRL